jgi:excisionase family DNA binding protein
MAIEAPPRIVTVSEFCRLFQLSERHVRDLIARQEIPVLRVGRRLVRINLDEAMRRLEAASK